MADCSYCGQKAGFLRRKHKDCETAYRAGRRQMVSRVAQAAGAADFSEAKLREDLAAIASACYIAEAEIGQTIAEGWHQAIGESLADSILTQEEEARLRAFRDQFALPQHPESSRGSAQLERASRDRLVLDARLAALATTDGEAHLAELATTLDDSPLTTAQQRELLVQAWEAAVEGSLEDGVLTLDEENALLRYLDRFGLSQGDVDANGAYRNLVKSAVIREAAEGIIPNRLGPVAGLPFNLMKSEQLVWVINAVDYYEVVTRRERRGSSHGLSIRVARGLYYRPSTFSSRPVEWEETVHVDTGVLGVTSKHIYFHGPRKRFRVRYDRIVSFEPYNDAIGIMRTPRPPSPKLSAPATAGLSTTW